LSAICSDLGWIIPGLKEMDNEIFFIDLPETLDKSREDSIDLFIKYLRSARYSEKTVKLYEEALRTFLTYYSEKGLFEFSEIDLIKFNMNYVLPLKYSRSYQNMIISALKIFFREVLVKKEVEIKLERPRIGHHIPEIFSRQEIEKLLQSIKNIKHRAAIALIYACGLRRSELINLKIQNIDSKRKLLSIKNGKGDKDRIVPLPDKMIEMLRECYKFYRPVEWLFEGSIKGQPWSDTSLREVFIRGLKSAGIIKNFTLHSLRHSYATHLLENGIDLRFIQVLLGHKSSRTTEIYTHVMAKTIDQIKSPFENLKL
jgi:integrase/recombinase XerD